MSGFSGNYLDALAHPVIANPVDAIAAGNRAAAAVWQNREWQARQAAGQAYQGAINQETGEFDPNKFRSLLAASGPAAMEAGRALNETQALSSNQLDQNIKKASWLNAAAGASLQSGDFSDAAMMRLFQTGMATGLYTLPEIQRQMALLPPDAAGRKQWLAEHQMMAANVQQQLEQRQGTQQTIGTPQGTYVVNVPPISANKTVVVPHGPTPGATTDASEPYDDQGIIPRDANGVPTRPPKGYTTIQKPVTAVPGVQPGGPPQIVPAFPPDYTGRPPPPPGLGNPAKAPPASAPPGAPPPAAAPPSPAAQPPVFKEPPQGQPEQAKANVTAYMADQAAYPDVQTRAQNLGHAYDALNALKNATGRGAQGINDLRSFAQTIGILPAGAVTEQKLFEIVHKYTERAMIDAAGGSSTDMGRHMAEQANAGTLLSTPANAEIIRNDMGKVMQNMAAYLDHKDKSGAGYLDHRAKIADATDPRGFVWNMYTPDEQAKINAEVANDPAAADKLHKAIGMTQRLKLQIPGLTTPWQTPQKQSFATPPPPSNALAYG